MGCEIADGSFNKSGNVFAEELGLHLQLFRYVSGFFLLGIGSTALAKFVRLEHSKEVTSVEHHMHVQIYPDPPLAVVPVPFLTMG